MPKSNKYSAMPFELIERIEELERKVAGHDEVLYWMRKMMRERAKPVRTNAISPDANVGSNPLRGLR